LVLGAQKVSVPLTPFLPPPRHTYTYTYISLSVFFLPD